MKRPIKTMLMPLALSAALFISFTSCSNDDEPEGQGPQTADCSGTYHGTITLNVADQYSYDAEIDCTITEQDNGCITVTLPEYELDATMMGDLTLGSITITDLAYDDTKGGYFRDYGGSGATQMMNGIAYPVNDPSSILVAIDNDGNIAIDNPYTLGKMPLPLTAVFTGSRQGK